VFDERWTEVRVFPDWGARWPLWAFDGGVDAPSLGLSDQLSADLEEWVRTWTAHFDIDAPAPHSDDEPLAERWVDEGIVLTGRLQKELGDRSTVVPEFEGLRPDALRRAEPS
jgi:hypothetical protein